METSYEDRLKAAIPKEFAHAKGTTYLDHAGTTLYSSLQLEEHMRDLASHLYGNPHSQNPSSQLSTEAIDGIRELVLRHFNTDSTHYDVIFTSGCTAALKLLAESFPWSGGDVSHTHRAKRTVDSTAMDVSNYVEAGDTYTRQTGLSEKETCQTGVTSQTSPEKINDMTLKSEHCPTDVVYLSNTCNTNAFKEGDTGKVFPSNCRNKSSIFCYLEDNHTSVVGMREIARCCGAKVVCTTANSIQTSSFDKLRTKSTTDRHTTSQQKQSPFHLFAYPAQSNFSGRKYPLAWCRDLSSGKVCVSGLEDLPGSWMVVLDAASYVSTSHLDLTSSPAHFVALSFYKMFGFPTGLGALLVRSDCAHLLKKDYYGGGTVLATVSRTGLHLPRPQLHDRFEDGTLSFLSILALKHGFNTLTRIGGSMEHISRHTFNIARYVYSSLVNMRYPNGGSVCQLYCETGFENLSVQGPIINFNLVKPDGQVVGYSVVERLATVHNIHLRTGCFCNTGACMAHLDLSSQRVELNLKAGHVCGDTMDIVDGHPTGSVRISFGYMSTMEDARKFVEFIEDTFLRPEEQKRATDPVRVTGVADGGQPARGSGSGGGSRLDRETSCDTLTAAGVFCEGSELEVYSRLRVGDEVEAFTKDGDSLTVGTLSQLLLYPVKSCASFSVLTWPLSDKGLLHDREWMVLSQHNSVLSQKQESRLCLVQPTVDLQDNRMVLTAEGHDSVEFPLETSEPNLCLSSTDSALRGEVGPSPLVRVCGDRIPALDCGQSPSLWLSRVLNRHCRLVRQSPDHQRQSKSNHRYLASGDTISSSLSLANEAQYLLVSDASVKQLLRDIQQSATAVDAGELTVESLTKRFRPNLVLSANVPPYAEETWEMLRIGKTRFKVVGGCSRCQMICVDQATGVRSPESLRTLTSLRGSQALFGIYLSSVRNVDAPGEMS